MLIQQLLLQNREKFKAKDSQEPFKDTWKNLNKTQIKNNVLFAFKENKTLQKEISNKIHWQTNIGIIRMWLTRKTNYIQFGDQYHSENNTLSRSKCKMMNIGSVRRPWQDKKIDFSAGKNMML